MIFARRHRLAPYLLLLPSAAVIASLVLWPTIQIAEFSFQNYGLPQLVGSEPTQWVGFTNYSHILHDPEFWLSLRLSVLSAAVMVPLTLIVGTLVGVLLSRLGRKMAAFVASVSVLAWATPAVSASVIFVWLATPDGGVVDWFLTEAAELAGRRRAVGRFFLDERRAAGLRAGNRRGGLDGLPVHRGQRAGRAADHTG